jgi:GT2 family glycosyltransferase
MSSPKISVIIVAYMAQDVILDCIESLLKQTYPKEKYEIIIVVDDSETFDAVRKYSSSNAPQIRIEYRTKRGNIPSARNVGIHLSNGEIIAFTDSDCVVHERWLERLGEKLEYSPTLVGVGGAVRPFSLDPVSRALALLNMVSWSGGEESLEKSLATSNAAYRRDVLTEVGGFDEGASVGEDVDLYRRVTQQGYHVLYDPGIIVYHKHRMRLRDIFFWCYSSEKKFIYILKKYKHYLPLIRQVTPALTLLALLTSVFILDLTSALLLVSILATLTYVMIFLFFGRNEYFSCKTGAILPIIVLTISFGFALGLVAGYFDSIRSTYRLPKWLSNINRH